MSIDLPLDASFQEYQNRIHSELGGFEHRDGLDEFQKILVLNQRFIDWERFRNQTSIPSALSIPSMTIMEWGPEIILNDLATFQSRFPTEMWRVLEGEPFPTRIPISDYQFQKYKMEFGRIATFAARWILLRDHLDSLEAVSYKDVRSYLALKKDPESRSRIRNWKTQSNEVQGRIFEDLVGICRNSNRSEKSCRSLLTKTIERDETPFQFYVRYLETAESNYERFFKISKKHPDLHLDSKESKIEFWMIEPEDNDKANWFRNAIAANFRRFPWTTIVEYRNESNLTRPSTVEFVPNVTAHADAIAGQKITLDLNDYRNDPGVAAHELGHLFGFIDCYLEFYNSKTKLMTYYTLESGNLMCARSGSILPKHFEALKMAYAEDRTGLGSQEWKP